MKLDYLNDLTGNGKYPGAYPTQLIRLYDFNEAEAKQLFDALHSTIIVGHTAVDLSTLDFIQAVNCRLRFEITAEDIGITIPPAGNDFTCKLTIASYEEMLGTIEVFTHSLKGYQWLDEPGEDGIHLLFSPFGTW